MKKKVKKELKINLICTNHQPRAESAIRNYKEKMSLFLWQKNEKSFRSYIKYNNIILSSINKNVKKNSFISQNTSINSLFSIKNVIPTFSNGQNVYKLWSAFKKKTTLAFKQSTKLGMFLF